MKAILTGTVTAFRYADVKGGTKVGQIDLMQHGDQKFPSKIVEVLIPSSAYCRLILEHLQNKVEPLISFLVYLRQNKEIEIEVIEMLSIYGDESEDGRAAATAD